MTSPIDILKALADETRFRIVLALEGRELCVCQLVALLDLAPSTVSKHLSILRSAGLVNFRKDGKWVFYFLTSQGTSPATLDLLHSAMNAGRLEVWHSTDVSRINDITQISREELIAAQTEGRTILPSDAVNVDRVVRVIFVCTANSARSQMAEGLLRHMAGDGVYVASAGTEPAVVNPFAIGAMAEIGIDISAHRSKSVYEFMDTDQFDYTIFVCGHAEKNCPAIYPLSKQRLAWPFDDPAATKGSDDDRLSQFRVIRDQIEKRIRSWLADEKPLDISRTGDCERAVR